MDAATLIFGGVVIGGVWVVLQFKGKEISDSTKTPASVAPKLNHRMSDVVQTLLAEPEPQVISGKATTKRVVTLEDHQGVLREAFRVAKKRIVIVSPFLSPGPIKADGITGLVRGAVSRGVEVIVFIDKGLNSEANGKPKASAQEARRMLVEAGAVVMIGNRLHNKTLCVDDTAIIEGSFNWLSAVRDKRHSHQREERSLLYQGGDANKMIWSATRGLAQNACKVAEAVTILIFLLVGVE